MSSSVSSRLFGHTWPNSGPRKICASSESTQSHSVRTMIDNVDRVGGCPVPTHSVLSQRQHWICTLSHIKCLGFCSPLFAFYLFPTTKRRVLKTSSSLRVVVECPWYDGASVSVNQVPDLEHTMLACASR